MIDAHVHIERGPYTLEWIESFVERALERGITELYLLEHSHRFIEFAPMYKSVIDYDPYIASWLSQRLNLRLRSYLDFVEKTKRTRFPLTVKFGLEVCYFREMEDFIGTLTREAGQLDFLTGSIHYINAWAFDHKAEFWNGKNVDDLYRVYYRSMIDMVRSGLFVHCAHPDSIKCFGFYPELDMSGLYESLSQELSRNDVKAEYSCGLFNNYGHLELGINPTLLGFMKKHGVELITASDAHRPEDVGKSISRCLKMLGNDYRVAGTLQNRVP